ncbi:MAG: cyclodeaminase/cyclohydrolase family protein [Planctomycetota bacterium]
MKVYLEDAAANKPAPGGGSISAIVGALGSAMGQMAANFTVGKEKYKDVEPQIIDANNRMKAAGDELARFMQADVDEYSKYETARTMPKSTDEEKAARKAAMQEALKAAMAVPLDVCRKATEVLQAASDIVDIANPYLITDVGVCAICALAALRGAKYNVAINIQSIKDDVLVTKVKKEMAALEKNAFELHDLVVAKVDSKVL